MKKAAQTLGASAKKLLMISWHLSSFFLDQVIHWFQNKFQLISPNSSDSELLCEIRAGTWTLGTCENVPLIGKYCSRGSIRVINREEMAAGVEERDTTWKMNKN